MASIGLSIELVRGFIFFGAEEFDEVDAFLFFTVARSAALVSFTSKADGGMELVLAQEELRNLVDFLQAQLMQLP